MVTKFKIKRNENNRTRNLNEDSWIVLWRQIFACSGSWVCFFVTGLQLGAPTVAIAAIRREANSTDAVSDKMASWLTSASIYSTIPWIVILPIFADYAGRRLPMVFTGIVSMGAFIIFYFSTTTTLLLISQVIQGVTATCAKTIIVFIITECTSPKYRGALSSAKTATLYWGIWVSNSIGTFFHWKYIGLVGIACTAYMLTAFLMPESPHWLACKKRYDDCTDAHYWFKGNGPNSEKELNQMLDSQKEYFKICEERETVSKLDRLKVTLKAMSEKHFYKPVLISIVVSSSNYFSGKLVYSLYAIDILKKVTGSESTAYTGMLVLDGVTILGMYIGSFLARFLRRKLFFLTSGSIAIGFLYILALYQYLINSSLVPENSIVSIVLLSAYSISLGAGPLILAMTIYCELIPLRMRSTATFIVVLQNNLLNGTLVKLGPSIFSTFGTHGAFLFFAIAASVCLLLVYIYLPETKDKSLQEIEAYFTDNKVKNKDGKV